MSKSIGLNKVIEHLEKEQERFYKAGKSNMFCDGENCLKTALAIGLTVKELKDYRNIFFD